MLIVSGLIGSVCAFLALLCGFSLGRSYEREKQKPNSVLDVTSRQGEKPTLQDTKARDGVTAKGENENR